MKIKRNRQGTVVKENGSNILQIRYLWSQWLHHYTCTHVGQMYRMIVLQKHQKVRGGWSGRGHQGQISYSPLIQYAKSKFFIISQVLDELWHDWHHNLCYLYLTSAIKCFLRTGWGQPASIVFDKLFFPFQGKNSD